MGSLDGTNSFRISRRFARRVALNVPMPVMLPSGRLRLERARGGLDRSLLRTQSEWSRSPLWRHRRGRASCRKQYSHTQVYKIGSEHGQPVVMTFRPAERNREILSFDEPRFEQPLTERCDHGGGLSRRSAAEKADHRHCWLLRARADRPRTAALPSSVMNSRRLIRSPRRRGRVRLPGCQGPAFSRS